jgi:UDP-N-acetylglucosamine--N-acetylmuramyl-(pentapeptide) pyrophosphoryl-undecaprenol N-acetylglucosamine transferase
LIFATVGTHHQPFTRMLDALATIADRDLIVQYGPGAAPAGVDRAEAFMPFDEMLGFYRRAEQVITHAGVGSILCAIREGHTPLVVPRRHSLGEHVDDHQAELSRALEERGSVVVAWDTSQLSPLLDSLPPRRQNPEARVPELCGEVRAALLGKPAQPSLA